MNIEIHGGCGTGVGGTDGWKGQPGGSPRGRYVTVSSRESCESASVGPGEISRAQGIAFITSVLFGQAAVRWSVFGVDENEPVRKLFYGGNQGRIGRG